MFTRIPLPPSFSLIKKGKVLLLLKEKYKNFLIQQGIEDLKTFLQKHDQTSKYLDGRTPHPSIPINDGKRMVLRQYSHGGIFRAITRNIFLFGSRSFRELAFTEKVRSYGIPTIEPVGAIHIRILFPLYQAYFLSLEVSHAMDLAQYFQEIGPHPSLEKLIHKRKAIRSAGLLLRQFHQAGFFHGDLQLKNILVADGQLLLIDFDRSYQKPILSTQERMKNLLRLNRSFEKWRRHGLSITRTDRLRFFLAYSGEDVKIRRAMQRILRTYTIRSFLYRLGWTLERVLGSQGSRGLGV